MTKRELARIRRDVETYMGTGRESTKKVLALLDALTPPETLAECEAIVGRAVDVEGSNYPWIEYLPNEFEFRAGDEAARLREAQRAVVVKRLADAGVIP